MNNHLKGVFAAAALALASSASYAADLSFPSFNSIFQAPVQTAKSGFVWKGVYIGGNAGLAYGEAQGHFGSDTQVSSLGDRVRPKDDYQTFAGGGQVGFNWQSGLFVFGLEGDLSSFADTETMVVPRRVDLGNGAVATGTVSIENRVEWLGTVRGRLGVAADRFFIYGTGGLAVGEVQNSAAVDSVTTVNGVFAGAGSMAGGETETQTGWTVGAGAEYAITNNLTGKLEYLYYDLGTSKYDTPDTTTGVADFYVRSKTEGNVVRAGLNFKW
jgi:outer membrane immunogenic protein